MSAAAAKAPPAPTPHVAAHEPVNEVSLNYLNRLSDLLFVLARVLARHERGGEVLWEKGRNRGRSA